MADVISFPSLLVGFHQNHTDLQFIFSLALHRFKSEQDVISHKDALGRYHCHQARQQYRIRLLPA